MTSSSIILSNILASESSELKSTIDSYMDTKLRDLQQIIKSNIDSFITEKIESFYGKSFDDHDKILFNKNGSHLITQYNGETKINIEQGSNKSNFPCYPLSSENTSCFTIAFSVNNFGNGIRVRELHFFQKIIIERNSHPPGSGNHRQWSYQIFKHNLSYDCLFAIKYFQVANEPVSESGVHNKVELSDSIQLLQDHPEYFIKKSSDFEEICRKEYAEIEKTKKQLKILMDEYISKKDYYATLEKEEKEKTKLE